MSLRVWCLLITHDRKIDVMPFYEDYNPDLIIADLMAKVATRMSLPFDHAHLFVYHSATLQADAPQEVLEPALTGLDTIRATVSPFKLVSEVVSGSELLVFRLPAPLLGTFPEPASSLETSQFNQQRIARSAPSSIALSANYLAMQESNDQRILDDRPQLDVNVAPIELLYRPFGEFRDTFTSGQLPKNTRMDLFEMEGDVMALAQNLATFHPEKKKKREEVLPLLNRIFKFDLVTTNFDGVESDGQSSVDGLIASVVELKNMTSGSTIPYVKCVSYVAHSHKAASTLRARYRLPALSITVTGNEVQFHAIILLRRKYRVVPLTPRLTVTNEFDQPQVLNAFMAACILQQSIHRDLEHFRQSVTVASPCLEPGAALFPAVAQIGTLQNAVRFRIVTCLAGTGETTHPGRHIYGALLDTMVAGYDSRSIIVKFCRSYSFDLHNFCANEGLAPRILASERLPGGWFAIAMEHLADGVPLDATSYSVEKEQRIRNLVAKFHREKLVHGDLRRANMLTSRNDVWLIDFDWGGRFGEAKYPTHLLHHDLLNGRQSRDLIIRQEDDLRILDATFNTLKFKSALAMLD